jgi:hypothetical protein
MKRLRAVTLVAVLAFVPTLAFAQRMASGPKNEFGVDVTLAYAKPSGGSGVFQIITPVDVRVGFLSGGPASFEFRFAGSLTTGGGATLYTLQPGLNILYRLSGPAANHNVYITGGAALDFIGTSGGGTSNSASVFSFNGGIGMHAPWGSNATRLEAFAGYRLKSTKMGTPNTLVIGARLGLSFFH